jgi:phage terminase Nu1 subunit (DNA packaging protein)
MKAKRVKVGGSQPRKPEKPLDGPQCRARRDLAQAKLLEGKNAKESGAVVGAELVERAWTAEVQAVRGFMLAFPARYTDRCYRAGTLDGLAGVERVLIEAVHEALRELSTGAHVKGQAARA